MSQNSNSVEINQEKFQPQLDFQAVLKGAQANHNRITLFQVLDMKASKNARWMLILFLAKNKVLYLSDDHTEPITVDFLNKNHCRLNWGLYDFPDPEKFRKFADFVDEGPSLEALLEEEDIRLDDFPSEIKREVTILRDFAKKIKEYITRYADEYELNK